MSYALKTLGQRCFVARVCNGKRSQIQFGEDIARAVNRAEAYSSTTVSKWEKDDSVPSRRALVGISRASGLSLDWLIYGDQETPEQNGTESPVSSYPATTYSIHSIRNTVDVREAVKCGAVTVYVEGRSILIDTEVLRASGGPLVCKTCQLDKSDKDFYWVHDKKMGRSRPQPHCKSCTAKRLRAWRQTDAGKASLRRIYAKRIADPIEGPKQRARQALNNAVASGQVTKGTCVKAGTSPCSGAVEAHHPDYTRPLEVEWRCRSHHLPDHIGKVGRKRSDAVEAA